MKLKLDEPILVAQGPTLEESGWGPWQFPQLMKNDEGTLFASVNLGPDSWESTEGQAWFKSFDNGQTWEKALNHEASSAYPKAKNGDGFLSLDGGAYDVDPSIFDGIEPVYLLYIDDGVPFYWYYKYSDFKPGSIRTSVSFARIDAKTKNEEIIHPDVTYDPGLCIVRPYNKDKVLANKLFGRLRVAPDGSLWQMSYGRGMVDGKFCDTFLARYYRSDDNGNSWKLVSTLDPRENPGSCLYCEQDIGWLDEKHAVTTIRANGMYVGTSDDGGYTWNTPKKIADFGVDPAVCVLKCGAILTTYGRPGFLVRACFDGKGENWEEPIEIIPTSDNTYKMNDISQAGNSSVWGTCSYSDIVPLSDNEALIVYTDYYVPDEKGIKRKSLMVIKATVED